MEVKIARKKFYREQKPESQTMQTSMEHEEEMSPEEELQQIKKARENYKKKQAEGIAAAKLRGVKFGRPVVKKPDCFTDIKQEYISGEISSRMAAKTCNVSQGTFLRWVKEADENDPEDLNREKYQQAETGGGWSNDYIIHVIEKIYQEIFSLKKEIQEMNRYILKAEEERDAALLKIKCLEEKLDSYHDMDDD